MNEEYIRGVESIYTEKSGHFLLFPILSAMGKGKKDTSQRITAKQNLKTRVDQVCSKTPT